MRADRTEHEGVGGEQDGAAVAAHITLSCGAVAIVDREDYGWISAHVWRLRKGYAGRSVNRGPTYDVSFVLMARAVVRARRGETIDHINGNRLDNRKGNLRRCSTTENSRNKGRRSDNTSGFKGVTFHKGVGKWMAQIGVGSGRMKYLGLFAEPADAARAYDAAARLLFGDFGRFNFPEPGERSVGAVDLGPDAHQTSPRSRDRGAR